jgi:hypothetical protein
MLSCMLLLLHSVHISMQYVSYQCPLYMSMNRHSCHASKRYFNACPPIVHSCIATNPLVVHAGMSICAL